MASRAVSLFVVLLLASTVFVSVFAGIPGPVYAAPPAPNLAPSSATIGTSVVVTGSGFAAASGTCTIASTPSGLFSASTCTYTAGSYTGSFTVAPGALAGISYQVTVKVAAETSDPANFIVKSRIKLTPNAGPVGTTVTVSGDGFNPANTLCTYSGNPAGLTISDVSCTFSAGVLTGGFRIASSALVPPTLYTITATPDVFPADAASAGFTVTSIPTITLSPGSGPPGTTVQVSGFGFSPSDTGCTITTAPPWLALVTQLSCSASGGSMTGSFKVSASAPSIFLPITLTGTPTNDFASATFTVTGPPAITLTPTSGIAGTPVAISTASLFSSADTSCTVTTTPSSPALLSGVSCSIAAGFVTGSFTVASSASGQVYTVTVTGGPGGDSASATFTVGPVATLSSYSGYPGQTITVSGSGFSPSDSSCSLTNAGPNFITPGYTCTISAGKVTGSFTVLSTATRPTANFITVTGNPASDSYGIPFVFSIVPRIILNPTSGNPGTVVTITGAGFNPTDAGACTLTSVPPGMLAVGWSCTIGGDGSVTGGFTVAGGAPPGGYSVTVTGGITGDPASALFNVGSPPTITLNPTVGTPGSTIAVTGAGFAASDVGSCTFTSGPGGLISSYTCTIASDHKLTGSIVVSPTALGGGYTVTAVGSSGDFTGAFFNVVPKITLNPTSGSGSTSVTVSGAGFGATDAGNCNFPANFFTTPGGLAAASACSISAGGILTASFTTVAAPPIGQYLVTVVGPTTSLSASATFTVTLPPSIILSPATGSGGDTITVIGTGFNTADSTCTITAANAVHPIVVPPIGSTSCTVGSNGAVTGSFVISTTIWWDDTWTIWATGNLGDWASTTLTIVPKITLSQSSGVVGSTVTITGVGFDWNDAGVFGGAAADPFLYATPVDILTNKQITFTAATGQVSASFTVWDQAAAGSYIITVTGSGISDSASAIFTVLPRIVTLSPTSGPVGTIVSVTGSQFDPAATTCTISFNPPLPVSGPVSCLIALGSVTGSFTVDSTALAGIYTVTVTTNLGDLGSATFMVTGSLTLTPDNGPRGITVSVTGTNFPAGDTGCTIGSDPPGLVSSEICTVSGGALAGTFVVSPTAAGGAYTVRVTTTPSGLVAGATFTVPPQPTITLTPNSGPIGTMVSVSGTNFATTDTTCSLSSVPGDLLQSPTCTVITGTVTASFTVAPGTAEGSYSVTVSGSPAGDSAPAFFTVTAHPAPTFVLSPTSGAAGTAVTISGTNYVGSTCSLSSLPAGLFTSSTCLLTSGTLSGGFDVAVSATHGIYTVTISTDAGETKSALFNVGATTLILSVLSGPVGTAVTASGSNYAGSTCTISSTPLGLISSPTCSISSGTLSGTFNVALGAPTGSYAVIVTTNIAGETGMAIFTVTPSAQPPPNLNLSSTSGPPGTAVTVSGEHFVGTTCSISSSPPGLLSSSSCSISGGTLTGGYTIATGASPGTYSIILTTNAAGEVVTATYVVNPPPGTATLLLSPTSAAPNSGVSISGSNYAGTTCSLSSSPSVLFSSSSCAISSGKLTGGFTVNMLASPGGYTVTVNTNTGEAISASFSVTRRTCIIATATFGSEASPAVQFLRNFRDGLVLSTKAGSAFMEAFNAWYYSFSPSVANVIAKNDALRAVMRVLLYPLLGALGLSAFTYSSFSWAPEFGVVMAGLVASSVIGLVYLTPLSLVGMRSLLKRRRIRSSVLALGALTMLVSALTALAVGEVAGSFLMMQAASSAVVLICMVAAPVMAALAIIHPRRK